jgi:aryl carrier-like protein
VHSALRKSVLNDYVIRSSPSVIHRTAPTFREDPVLGVASLGVHESFFDVGGSSITAVQVQQRLQQAGHVIPLVALFQYPTVAALARFIDGGASESHVRDGQSRAELRKALRRRGRTS